MGIILRRFKRITIFIAVFAVIVGSVCSTVKAAELNSKDMISSHIWYQPQYLSSTDEAFKVFVNFAAFYSNWGGYDVQQINADKTGIRIIFGLKDENQQMQTVPINISSNITSIDLYNYPNLNRDYKWGLDIFFTDRSIISLRTKDLDTAQRLADALATIAAANQHYLSSDIGLLIVNKDLDSVFAKLKWPKKTGIVVDSVYQGGPAENAGLKHNDIIFEGNSQPINNTADFWNVVNPFIKNNPSATVNIKVFRAEQALDIQLTVPNFNYGNNKIVDSSAKPFGLAARNLTADEMQKAVILKTGGLLVTSVTTSSPAEQMGLKAGDIILEINGKAVANTDDLRQALASGNIQVVKAWRNSSVITLNSVSSF
jgi:membrane-associated protease RseP (regulator of RpoE activity)